MVDIFSFILLVVTQLINKINKTVSNSHSEANDLLSNFLCTYVHGFCHRWTSLSFVTHKLFVHLSIIAVGYLYLRKENFVTALILLNLVIFHCDLDQGLYTLPYLI